MFFYFCVIEKDNGMSSPQSVRFHKSVTNSSLVPDHSSDSPKLNHFPKKKTQMLSRGTSTADSETSDSFNEVFHEPLHKTMTM